MTDKSTQTSPEIDLIYLVLRFIDKLHYIVMAALIGALAISAAAGDTASTILYTATSRIYLIDTEDAVNRTLNISVANSMVANYVAGFSGSELHKRVAEKSALPYTADQLKSMVSISNALQTHILDISVTSAVSAAEAKLLANTYASVSCEFFKEKFNLGTPTVFEEATLPAPTLIKSKSTKPVIGAIAGAALSAIVILIQALFASRMRIPGDIAACTAAPLLGAMTIQRSRRSQSAHKEAAR